MSKRRTVSTSKIINSLSVPTPIDTVEVTIGFRGEFDSQTTEDATKQMRAIITGLKGTIVKEEITAETTSDALYVRFSLEGNNKVDVAFRLEEMVNSHLHHSITF